MHFHIWHFHPVRSALLSPAISCPAFSPLAISMVRHFHVLHFYVMWFWSSGIFTFFIFSRPITSLFRFVTIHAFDRQTDGQKGLGNTAHCITCSRMVKQFLSLKMHFSWYRQPYWRKQSTASWKFRKQLEACVSANGDNYEHKMW